MIQRVKELLAKYREGIAYLFFGGLATLLNIVLGVLFRYMGIPTTLNTLLDNALCILFAYVTNRLWVFHSSARGMAALREFGSFVACRLGTLVLDVAVMWLGVDLLGAALVPPAGQDVWFLGVKVLANVLVIVFNYVFSKLVIFKKKG